MAEDPQVTEETQAEEESPDVGALQAERDELFDRLQRLAAEFDNYRKRSARAGPRRPRPRARGRAGA